MTRMVGSVGVLGIIVLICIFGGAAPAQAAPSHQSTLPPNILQAQWTLQYFNSDAKAAGKDVSSSKITIKFEADGSLAGFGGCNNYFGTYVVSGEKMTISDKIGSTMMACDEQVMSTESLYFRLLPTVNGYRLIGDTLDLIYADGASAMTFISGPGQTGASSLPAEVLQTEWILRYFNGKQPDNDVAAARISIKFEPDGTLAGFAGCNNYSGAYTVSGRQISVPANLATTRMACPAGPTALETRYLRLLPTVKSYTVSDNQLQLVYADDGSSLVYVPQNAAPQVEPTPAPGMPTTGEGDTLRLFTIVLGAFSLLGAGLLLRFRIAAAVGNDD